MVTPVSQTLPGEQPIETSHLEALDERMGRLEDGLAQVAAALAQLNLSLSQASGVTAPKPSGQTKPDRKRTTTPSKDKRAAS